MKTREFVETLYRLHHKIYKEAELSFDQRYDALSLHIFKKFEEEAELFALNSPCIIGTVTLTGFFLDSDDTTFVMFIDTVLSSSIFSEISFLNSFDKETLDKYKTNLYTNLVYSLNKIQTDFKDYSWMSVVNGVLEFLYIDECSDTSISILKKSVNSLFKRKVLAFDRLANPIDKEYIANKNRYSILRKTASDYKIEIEDIEVLPSETIAKVKALYPIKITEMDPSASASSEWVTKFPDISDHAVYEDQWNKKWSENMSDLAFDLGRMTTIGHEEFSGKLHQSDADYVVSILDYYKKKGKVSMKQRKVLDRVHKKYVAKLRNPAYKQYAF